MLLLITIIVFIIFVIVWLFHMFYDYQAGHNYNLFEQNTDYAKKLSIVIDVVIIVILILFITGFVLLLRAEFELLTIRKKKKLEKQGKVILITAAVFAVGWFFVYRMAAAQLNKPKRVSLPLNVVSED